MIDVYTRFIPTAAFFRRSETARIPTKALHNPPSWDLDLTVPIA